ncbi:MAG: hypothetical protein PUE91_11440 [Clostridiales bacterium]|nr:hypothetical protein [Clostridiales bacterium]
MDILRAIEILGSLAQGIDPYNGEVLEENHICNQPETIRAFYCILRELERREEQSRKRPENAGQPWNQEDDEKLWRLYQDNVPIRELQKIFKRSRGSIEARLDKIDRAKLEERLKVQKDREQRIKEAADIMQRVYSKR